MVICGKGHRPVSCISARGCRARIGGGADLAGNEQRDTIGIPGHRVGSPKALNLVDRSLCPDIPKFDDTIRPQTGQLGIFDGVERHFFNRS